MRPYEHHALPSPVSTRIVDHGAPQRAFRIASGDIVIVSTSSYHRYRPEWGLAVRTSVGRARWFTHPQVHARTLTPFGIFGVIDDQPDYTAAYLARLDGYGRRVIDELEALTGGEGVVLLCHCNLSKPGAWCHRTIAATWLHDRFGLDVSEADDGPPVSGRTHDNRRARDD